MVLDGTFLASTIASLMMNGVCCVWQMQEEEDRRDAIRRDIRVEYERQRREERELWEQRADSERWELSDSSMRDGRRRKLMADKMSVSSDSGRRRFRQRRYDERDENASLQFLVPHTVGGDGMDDGHGGVSSPVVASSVALKRRVRSLPAAIAYHTRHHHVSAGMDESPNDVSSLMDFHEEDSTDVCDLVDVTIQ